MKRAPADDRQLDERLTIYHDDNGWRRMKLQAMGSKKVAEAVGTGERRQDILKGTATPRAEH